MCMTDQNECEDLRGTLQICGALSMQLSPLWYSYLWILDPFMFLNPQLSSSPCMATLCLASPSLCCSLETFSRSYLCRLQDSLVCFLLTGTIVFHCLCPLSENHCSLFVQFFSCYKVGELICSLLFYRGWEQLPVYRKPLVSKILLIILCTWILGEVLPSQKACIWDLLKLLILQGNF